MSRRFRPTCKACEQKRRNEKKNADRPKAIIEGRAEVAAMKAGVSKAFFMTEMGYEFLIPRLAALMLSGARCGCGHAFLNERDIQIDHIEPPRFDTDWGRLHFRNLQFLCGSCNPTKGNKPFALWLDEQEDARLSNLQQPTVKHTQAQMSLFD